MNHSEAIRAQYHAALEMLWQAVSRCPPSLWDNPDDRNRFWHVAYHALFYTHLYLQNSLQEFRPWADHREQYERLGPLPSPPHDQPRIGEAYSQEQVLAYLDLCWQQVQAQLAVLNLQAEASGFPWLPFGKLELQLYNIRHLQLHTGELMERLGAREHIDVDWIATKPEATASVHQRKQ